MIVSPTRSKTAEIKVGKWGKTSVLEKVANYGKGRSPLSEKWGLHGGKETD